MILYKAEDLLKNNIEYKLKDFDPRIFLIGSNGGGEAVAIDLRKKDFKYILIPFIFEYDAIIELGNDINNFFHRLFNIGYFE